MKLRVPPPTLLSQIPAQGNILLKIPPPQPPIPQQGALMPLGGEEEDPMGKEMRILYKRNLSFDNKPAIEVVRSAASKNGINPALLFSSSFQEGFNKAIAKPDEASQAFINATAGKYDNGKGKIGVQPKLDANYQVDGFGMYGLDTFTDRFPDLVKKGYLPKDFDFKPYKAFNEKDELVNTVAFRNNEDALTAKAAFLKMEMDYVNSLAKSKGISLDEDAKNYFTLVSYNSGQGNAKKMIDKYIAAKDKKAFIEKGDSEWQRVHTNVSPRMRNMKIAQELLDEK